MRHFVMVMAHFAVRIAASVIFLKSRFLELAMAAFTEIDFLGSVDNFRSDLHVNGVEH
jgi:hypothetical protein